MLNKKEQEQLSGLLKKIDDPHAGLPQPVFEALLKVVPFVACEIVVIGKDGIFLTWRNDKWFKGWHFPGGLMRFNEDFKERIDYVVKNELDAKLKSYHLLFVENFNFSQRGHTVSLVFLCELDSIPKVGKFFKKIPKDILKSHRDIWKKIEEILK